MLPYLKSLDFPSNLIAETGSPGPGRAGQDGRTGWPDGTNEQTDTRAGRDGRTDGQMGKFKEISQKFPRNFPKKSWKLPRFFTDISWNFPEISEDEPNPMLLSVSASRAIPAGKRFGSAYRSPSKSLTLHPDH